MNALLLGLFGGAGATLLWELIIRPARVRRAVAEALFVECGHNLQVMAAARAAESLAGIPTDFYAGTLSFESLRADVGNLPPRLAGDVAYAYTRFGALNRLRSGFDASVTERRQLGGRIDLLPAIAAEQEQMLVAFAVSIDSTLSHVSALLPRLEAEAYPWWSIRRWQRERSTTLTDVEMAKRLSELEEKQAAAWKRLRAKPRSRTT